MASHSSNDPFQSAGATPAASPAPKIIVDSDWKSQAQAEKAKLEQAAANKQAQQQAKKTQAAVSAVGSTVGEMGASGESEDENRPIGFDDLVGMLGMQAMTYMGMVPDPQSGRAVVSLEYAKMNIDLLGILEEKTKGNLSEREQAQLAKMLGELRMSFVELTKVVAKAIQEGKIKNMGGPPGVSAPAGPSLRMTQ